MGILKEQKGILMNGINKNKGLVRVSVYLNEQELVTAAKDSERAGFRRVGIPLKKQKPHGLADEWLANTDGISRLFKMSWEYWRKAEPERLRALAEEEEKIQAALKRKQELEKGRV